jgi:alpha-aminoadipic semialdehyde synthase
MIGIRAEDKSPWERRVPLVPGHVAELAGGEGVEFCVQPSDRRAIADSEYRSAGARLSEDLASCSVILGVKEIPAEKLIPGKAHVFFSHVIKGQHYNMPMLRRLLELGCTLIDYEKVTDDSGRRLIFFGRHAGLAGMIDTLWALGARLEAKGLTSPLSELRAAHRYDNLEDAKTAVREAGSRLAAKGLPDAIPPLTFGFAGYGNVSLGAQEILDLLPHREVGPSELARAAAEPDRSRVIKVVFKEEHMAVPLDPGRPFDLQEYYDHPERFRGVFARYVPHLTVLVNCIYWTSRYPRLVTRDLLHGLYGAGHRPRLEVIGDISCDIEGAVECTLQATDPGEPVYVYLPDEDRIAPGLRGHGPVVLAVDNLPCELPLESSRDFSDALAPFIPDLERCNWSRPLDELSLPAEIRRAVIAHRGELTPEFLYLKEFLDGS